MFFSVHFFDKTTGLPLTGLSTAAMLQQYVDRNGVALTPKPTVSELGNGAYGVEVPAADVLRGVIMLFYAATGDPTYHLRVASADGLAAMLYLADVGTLYAGAGTPSWTLYKLGDGSTPTAPTFTAVLGAYLYASTIPAEHLAKGVAALVTHSGAALPKYVTGTFTTEAGPSAPPVVPATATPALSPIQLATDDAFGVDVATWPQLSESFLLVSGRRVVAEAMYRRLTTQRGQLAFHPDVGQDVRAYLNESMTDAAIFAIRNDVEQEVRRDQRVEDATATVNYSASDGTLSIAIEATTALGPFTLTLQVNALTVTMLYEEES